MLSLTRTDAATAKPLACVRLRAPATGDDGALEKLAACKDDLEQLISEAKDYELAFETDVKPLGEGDHLAMYSEEVWETEHVQTTAVWTSDSAEHLRYFALTLSDDTELFETSNVPCINHGRDEGSPLPRSAEAFFTANETRFVYRFYHADHVLLDECETPDRVEEAEIAGIEVEIVGDGVEAAREHVVRRLLWCPNRGDARSKLDPETHFWLPFDPDLDDEAVFQALRRFHLPDLFDFRKTVPRVDLCPGAVLWACFKRTCEVHTSTHVIQMARPFQYRYGGEADQYRDRSYKNPRSPAYVEILPRPIYQKKWPDSDDMMPLALRSSYSLFVSYIRRGIIEAERYEQVDWLLRVLDIRKLNQRVAPKLKFICELIEYLIGCVVERMIQTKAEVRTSAPVTSYTNFSAAIKSKSVLVREILALGGEKKEMILISLLASYLKINRDTRDKFEKVSNETREYIELLEDILEEIIEKVLRFNNPANHTRQQVAKRENNEGEVRRSHLHVSSAAYELEQNYPFYWSTTMEENEVSQRRATYTGDVEDRYDKNMQLSKGAFERLQAIRIHLSSHVSYSVLVKRLRNDKVPVRLLKMLEPLLKYKHKKKDKKIIPEATVYLLERLEFVIEEIVMKNIRLLNPMNSNQDFMLEHRQASLRSAQGYGMLDLKKDWPFFVTHAPGFDYPFASPDQEREILQNGYLPLTWASTVYKATEPVLENVGGRKLFHPTYEFHSRMIHRDTGCFAPYEIKKVYRNFDYGY